MNFHGEFSNIDSFEILTGLYTSLHQIRMLWTLLRQIVLLLNALEMLHIIFASVHLIQ